MNDTIKRVIFIGDLCRGDQAGNVARVQRLFSPVFTQLGISWNIHVTEINRSLQLDEWLETWKQSLTCARNLELEAIDFGDAAVIGFEVPERDLQYLDQHGVPWVNLAIHPLRFLDDLYFEVSTSFAADIQRHAASIGLIDLCVQALRTRYPKAQAAEPHPSTLAIFGQTPIDKSVYFDGEFRKLDSYLSSLDELASKHEIILFKPHPYLTDPEVDKLVCERYGASPANAYDVYELFITGGITTACAISSSVISEAPHFGISAEFLEPRAKRFGPPISFRSLLDDQNFWAEGLLRSSVSTSPIRISQAVPPNYLRRIFSSWGFVTDEQSLEARLAARQADFQQSVAHQFEIQANQINDWAVQQAEIRAQQAETNAQQARLMVQEAELRAEQRLLELERRALTAEAATQAEAAHAQVAEARAAELERRASVAETRTAVLERRALAAEASLHQWQQQASIWNKRVIAIHNSTSWKISKPLRAIKRLVGGDFSIFQRSMAAAKRNAKQAFRPILSSAIRQISHRPMLRSRASSLVKKFPWLHQRLYRIAVNTDVILGGSQGLSRASANIPPITSPDAVSMITTMTPRACEIYANLKATINRKNRENC